MDTVPPAQPPPARPAVMGPYRPDWLEKPSADDLSGYYPEHAARHDIAGKATIVCKVMPDGRLNECRVASESPTGEHFGEAALKLSPKFRMIPPDDPALAPATVTVPLVFEVPASQATSETARELKILANLGVDVAVGVGAALVLALMVVGRYRLTVKRWSRKP